jgi:hypothetical protein
LAAFKAWGLTSLACKSQSGQSSLLSKETQGKAPQYHQYATIDPAH